MKPLESTANAPEEIDPRVVFAAEPYSPGFRTGLALMGFGFVVARFGLFLREIVVAQHRVATATGCSLWLGTAFVALGVIVNIVAIRQHLKVVARLNRCEKLFSTSPSLATSIAAVLAVLGVGMAVYLLTTGR